MTTEHGKHALPAHLRIGYLCKQAKQQLSFLKARARGALLCETSIVWHGTMAFPAGAT